MAVVFLISLFLFPMWKIILYAPQYPDGVEMHIWINKISGNSPGTLQNVNILNHYVGMKYIEPDAIPELKYFQYVILFLMALGIGVAIIDNRWLYLSWTLLFALLCTAGLYDFYLWEYDYGHNLSDTAPIKIPGASFQPPLFGKKIILNFIAVSIPHIAGYFVGLSMLFSAGAWWIKTKQLKNEKTVASGTSTLANGL